MLKAVILKITKPCFINLGITANEKRGKELNALFGDTTHFVYGYMTSDTRLIMLYLYWRKEGNVLFNDALDTFLVWLYGIRHMIKGPQRLWEKKPAAATSWATLPN